MCDFKEIYTADVAVFGAGPAGLAAAWQAGMSGKRFVSLKLWIALVE